MNYNSSESPKAMDKKCILLIGPPGGCKTTLAMQFPNVCFFDCDQNLDGPRQALKRIMGKEPTFAFERVWMNDSNTQLAMHECFDNLIQQLDNLKAEIQAGKSQFKFACIDGLRVIGEMIKQKLFKKNARDMMETRDWDPYKTSFIKLLVVKARDLGIHTIFTCHERAVYQQSGNPKEMMKEHLVGYEPLLQGGIQDGFAGFFTDVWRITRECGGGMTTEMKITTVKGPLTPDLKSSIGLPNEITIKENELAWPKLAPYFEGCL
jgi:AAA domain-containing protein